MTTQASKDTAVPVADRLATGALVLADGSIFWGYGIGAHGSAVGEVCFNTSMTGYQEILTDPSYAGQIVAFTFPHIGNVGVNPDDREAAQPQVRGLVLRELPSEPSNWRSLLSLEDWLREYQLIGLCGIDTRRLTRYVRDHGAPVAAIGHGAGLDPTELRKQALAWPGLDGLELASSASCRQGYTWEQGLWKAQQASSIKGRIFDIEESPPPARTESESSSPCVVVIDYGVKYNSLRWLAALGCQVVVVPARTSYEEIVNHRPGGIFLSNGPGDPAATAEYAVPVIRRLIQADLPVFGVCLGHQLLALALGGSTAKMKFGHHGANHPVRVLPSACIDHRDHAGRIEITTQNHGFVVIPKSLPEQVLVTHTSQFDDSNEGIQLANRPVFSVQYHPEASPGPQDSHYLFRRFVEAVGRG